MSKKHEDHQFKQSLRNTPPRAQKPTSISQKKKVPVFSTGGSYIASSSSARKESPYASSVGGKSANSDGTRYSLREFKAVTGKTPGTARHDASLKTARDPWGLQCVERIAQ